MSLNLFKSGGGSELAPEICLSILERAIAAEPRKVGRLMTLSRAFRGILKEYESSICDHIIDSPKYAQVNAHADQIILSTPSPYPIHRKKYRWVSELQFRVDITNALINSTPPTTSSSRLHPLPPLKSRADSERRVAQFKREGIALIWALQDVTVGQPPHRRRQIQTQYLETLGASDLASLMCIVKVFAVDYIALMESRDSDVCAKARDNICVFEDKVLRCGAYFACYMLECWERLRNWSALEHVYMRCWAENAMNIGMKEMMAFEERVPRALPSMQSVVWVLLSKMTGTEMRECWSLVAEMAQEKMNSYEFDIKP